MDKQKALTAYTDAGYSLFAVNGKAFPPTKWEQTDFNPYLGMDDFSQKNLAVCLQPDDLVIDVDIENDKGEPKQGAASLKKLAQDIGYNFKDTCIVKTGGNGLHIYLKKPATMPVREKWPEYPDIEFKSVGRYVVGASGVHPRTKNIYKLVQNGFDNIQNAPTPLLELIKSHPPTEPELDTPEKLPEFFNNEQNILRAVGYLKRAEPAIEYSGGNSQTYKTACQCRAHALGPQIVYDLMLEHYNPRCEPPWPTRDLKNIVANAFKYDTEKFGSGTAEFDFKDVCVEKNIKSVKAADKTKGGRRASLKNIVDAFGENLKFENLFKYNLFSGDVEFIKRPLWYTPDEQIVPWRDCDTIDVKMILETDNLIISANNNTINEAAYIKAKENTYHPLRDYLTGLKWDGIPRIDNWLTDFLYVEKNVYTSTIGTKVLLAAVGRVLDPGASFHCVLILEGGQGCGKSYFIKNMCPKEEWYGDLNIDPHKYADTVAAMRKKWIVEISEMAITRKDVISVKSFLSKNEDRVRMPYGRLMQDYPRQCIFIGTFNPDNTGYLDDTTGNRRFWPVQIPIKSVDGVPEKFIDTNGFLKVRDQIWAEAVHRYKNGEENLHIDEMQVMQAAAREVEKRTPEDGWIEPIREWLTENWDDGAIKTKCRGIDVFSGAIGGTRQHFGRFQSSRIIQIMKKFGWEQKAYTDPRLHKTVRGFVKPKEEEEELEEL